MASIILAEDDSDVRLVMRLMLEGDGHTCLDFSNGDDALDALRKMPDVTMLILDVFLASSDGRDLVTILRNGPPRFRKMPILLISGVVSEQTIRQYASDQYCQFLKKPFTCDQLGTVINSLLFPQSF
ncbi:MAG: response regulator [Pseudomonadota bacterium]